MASVEGVWCSLLDTFGFLDRCESVNSTLSFHMLLHIPCTYVLKIWSVWYRSMRFGTRLWSKTLIYPSKWLRTGMDHYGYFNTTEQVSGIGYKQTRGFGDGGIVHSGPQPRHCALCWFGNTPQSGGVCNTEAHGEDRCMAELHIQKSSFPTSPKTWTRPSGSSRATLALQRRSLQMAKSLIVSILWTGLGNRCVGWGATPPLTDPFNLFSRQVDANHNNHLWPTAPAHFGGCMKMKGCVRVECFLQHTSFREGEVAALREKAGRGGVAGNDDVLDYLLSSRLRPAMCWSKDLTPKPLLLLPLRAPSSLTGVDASCLSLHSCGEPRLLLSDLYCRWTQRERGTMRIHTV